MSWLVRRARFRGLKGGRVQTVRSEVFDGQVRDKVERHQDYGFAAQVVDGEGLVIEAGGHTFVLRMDRTAERPEMAPYDVFVWHKEQHFVALMAGRVVQVDCDRLVVNAGTEVVFNTPKVSGTGDADFAGTVTGQADVVFAGKSSKGHKHPNIRRGDETSDSPQ